MAVYVKDLDAYQEAVHKLKLHFVSEEELKALEARKDTTESLPQLKENETRITRFNLKRKSIRSYCRNQILEQDCFTR